MLLKDDRLQRTPECLDAFVRCYYERDLAVRHEFLQVSEKHGYQTPRFIRKYAWLRRQCLDLTERHPREIAVGLDVLAGVEE